MVGGVLGAEVVVVGGGCWARRWMHLWGRIRLMWQNVEPLSAD